MAKKKIFAMTPFGSVTWASIQKPSKVRDGANGPKPDEYQCRIEVTEEELTAWKAKMKAEAEKAGHAFVTKGPKLGVSVNEETGKVTLMAKSQFKPAVFDAKNNRIDDARIGNGSVVRMNVGLNFYDKGVSLVLSQVQVKKLVEYSAGGNGASAFGETDGYEGENTGFGAGVDDTPATTEKDVDALGI